MLPRKRWKQSEFGETVIRVFPNQIVLQINVKKKEAKMLALPLLLKGQFLHISWRDKNCSIIESQRV